MRGGFFSSSALLLLGIGCGGATTKSPAEGQPERPVASGGAAQTDDGPAPSVGPEPPSCDCLPFAIAWWRDGGLVPTSVHARIDPCAEYVLEQRTAEPGITEVCESTLEGCGDAYGVDDIMTALQHPEVEQALADAPVIYGGDPRGLDGQVDHIEVGGKVIEIGDECDLPECRIPLGVQNFGRLLGFLQLQELERNACEH